MNTWCLAKKIESPENAPFKIGDLVILDRYYSQVTRLWENNIVRRVVMIRKSCCNGGWLATVDMGIPCECCSLPAARNSLTIASGFLINAVTGYQQKILNEPVC